MKLHIKEFAKLTGVSVRTLHYYDEIGLLRPASVDRSSGYRFYDESSLLRMQEILFFRELDFPLKQIAELLSSPDHDTRQSLEAQKQLLTLKKERLERLIASIDDAMKGENVMKAFDNSEYEAYKAEAQKRWGNTEAYREYTEKSKDRTKQDQNALAAEMDGIMAEFAACKQSGKTPASREAQALVRKLQAHITAHYYQCTDAILCSLGQMYVADERFRSNIDRHGEGTAAFSSEAIRHLCGQ